MALGMAVAVHSLSGALKPEPEQHESASNPTIGHWRHRSSQGRTHNGLYNHASHYPYQAHSKVCLSGVADFH